MTIQDLVNEFGDGNTKAVQIGGVSGFCVPRAKFGDFTIGYPSRLTGDSLPTGGVITSYSIHYTKLYEYAYESDVLYAFSVPGYFYKGYRTYLTVKYDISKSLTVWLRYAQTTYSDRNVISEGSLDEIDGNKK